MTRWVLLVTGFAFLVGAVMCGCEITCEPPPLKRPAPLREWQGAACTRCEWWDDDTLPSGYCHCGDRLVHWTPRKRWWTSPEVSGTWSPWTEAEDGAAPCR